MTFRPVGNEATAVLVIDRPEDCRVGCGDLDPINFFARKELEVSLVDGRRNFMQGLTAIKEEHQPVGLALVAFFRNHAEEVQVGSGDSMISFFSDFAYGTFEGRFAFGGF